MSSLMWKKGTMTQRNLGHGHYFPKKAWNEGLERRPLHGPDEGESVGPKTFGHTGWFLDENIWPYQNANHLAIPKKWQPSRKKRGYGQMACDSVWPNIFARKMGRKWATNIWPYRVFGTQKFGHTGCLRRLIIRASGHEDSNA